MGLCTQMLISGFLLGSVTSVLAVDLGTDKNGCLATDNDFTTTEIYQGPIPSSGSDNSANAVLKLAFDGQPNNSVDVYFIQKFGGISRYNGSTKTVDLLGTVKADHFQEHGLVGIALDPNFKSNRYIYLNYSFIESDKSYSTRISRFTLGAGVTGKIDMASEKVLLKINRQENNWHTAGAMAFDAYGDLYCTIGDNQQSEMTAGNTGDLRGGILRIHPDSSVRGYSIPKGNFGETFSAYFKSQGNAEVATQYADTNKVRPEIYVKGTRNPYTMGLDPVRRWLTWGEVGPDQGKVSEEYNRVRAPIFGGWPYFAGAENMGAGSASGGPATGPYGTAVPLMSNPNTITNNLAGIKGVKNLPPNQDPIFQKTRSCAVSGPIFRYDGANPSTTQFPPQFDHKWLISDCNGSVYGFRLLSFNATGDALVGGDALKIFAGNNGPKTNTIVDMKQGPDGALYIVDWGEGTIARMDYKGKCTDPTLLPEKTGCTDPAAINFDAALPAAFSDPRLCSFTTATHSDISFTQNPVLVNGRMITIALTGGYELQILDITGRTIYAVSGEGFGNHILPTFAHSGIYQIEVKSKVGVFHRRVMGINP